MTYLQAGGIGRGAWALPGQQSLIKSLYNAEVSDLSYLLRSGSASAGGPRLPMNMQSVQAVAEKYGLDTTGIPFNINKAIAGVAGEATPNGTVNLYRDAFANEEQLARTLAHEIFHTGQIQANGYPRTVEEFAQYEAEAQAFEDQWWEGASEP